MNSNYGTADNFINQSDFGRSETKNTIQFGTKKEPDNNPGPSNYFLLNLSKDVSASLNVSRTNFKEQQKKIFDQESKQDVIKCNRTVPTERRLFNYFHDDDTPSKSSKMLTYIDCDRDGKNNELNGTNEVIKRENEFSHHFYSNAFNTTGEHTTSNQRGILTEVTNNYSDKEFRNIYFGEENKLKSMPGDTGNSILNKAVGPRHFDSSCKLQDNIFNESLTEDVRNEEVCHVLDLSMKGGNSDEKYSCLTSEDNSRRLESDKKVTPKSSIQMNSNIKRHRPSQSPISVIRNDENLTTTFQREGNNIKSASICETSEPLVQPTRNVNSNGSTTRIKYPYGNEMPNESFNRLDFIPMKDECTEIGKHKIQTDSTDKEYSALTKELNSFENKAVDSNDATMMISPQSFSKPGTSGSEKHTQFTNKDIFESRKRSAKILTDVNEGLNKLKINFKKFRKSSSKNAFSEPIESFSPVDVNKKETNDTTFVQTKLDSSRRNQTNSRFINEIENAFNTTTDMAETFLKTRRTDGSSDNSNPVTGNNFETCMFESGIKNVKQRVPNNFDAVGTNRQLSVEAVKNNIEITERKRSINGTEVRDDDSDRFYMTDGDQNKIKTTTKSTGTAILSLFDSQECLYGDKRKLSRSDESPSENLSFDKTLSLSARSSSSSSIIYSSNETKTSLPDTETNAWSDHLFKKPGSRKALHTSKMSNNSVDSQRMSAESSSSIGDLTTNDLPENDRDRTDPFKCKKLNGNSPETQRKINMNILRSVRAIRIKNSTEFYVPK